MHRVAKRTVKWLAGLSKQSIYNFLLEKQIYNIAYYKFENQYFFIPINMIKKVIF